MAPMSRPTLIRNESMQKYMLLSAQKEALQRRMALEIPFNKPMTASSPEFQSLSSSPTWSPKYASPYPPPTDPIPIGSRASMGPRSSIDDTHTEESHRLSEINHQIVATLTELLNTESVRSDDRHRAWIQERLMEAEHQIRRERRRHSSNAERDFASSIAHQLELGLNTSKTWA
ncbi:Nn.00g111620.m01.CDS01 [Neocucurbitaria sp. VM-36]